MADTQTKQKISSIEIDVKQLSNEIQETDDSLTELEKSVIELRAKQEFVDKSLEQTSDDTLESKTKLTELNKQLDEVKTWQSNATKIISWIGVTFSGSIFGLIAKALYNYVTEIIKDGQNSN